MGVMDWVIKFIQGGLGSLASYLAAHVLLCLLPAFFYRRRHVSADPA